MADISAHIWTGNPTVSSTVRHVPVRTDLLLLQWLSYSHFSWPVVTKNPFTVNNSKQGVVSHILSRYWVSDLTCTPLHALFTCSLNTAANLYRVCLFTSPHPITKVVTIHTKHPPEYYIGISILDFWATALPAGFDTKLLWALLTPLLTLGRSIRYTWAQLTAPALKHLHDFVFVMHATSLFLFSYLRTI